MNSQNENPANKPGRLDAIIVGAGFAGLYALFRLRGMGLRAHVLEAGQGVGGTWYWNRYPGARCDVESLEYSYSFSDALQQDWDWPERFSPQADILAYINHVADRFDLRRDITLEARVVSAVFDDRTRRWTAETASGARYTAPYLVMATGNLSLPRVPDFPGLDRFAGRWFHTGQWPHAAVDFRGRRVGVIGTGSSGIQLIPVVAEQAAHLDVFQRTANFSLPAQNRPLTAEAAARHKRDYGEWRARARATPFGIAGHPPPQKHAFDDPPAERDRVYTAKWGTGGNISFLYAYKDLLVDGAANETAAEYVRQRIREIVHDPVTAELLSPRDHPIGTKRLCLDSGYYETFNRDTVRLVDVRSDPIVEITPEGVHTERAAYPLDDIIFATGFDAMTGALLDIDIRGHRGKALRDKWADGPNTYLGLMTAGFPNLFIITGPGSPSVKANMVSAIEQHVDWIADCLAFMRARGIATIDANPDNEAGWGRHVTEVAEATLYPRASSWYLGANIPGKPRVFMPYVAGLDRYRAICDSIAADHYPGFVFAHEA